MLPGSRDIVEHVESDSSRPVPEAMTVSREGEARLRRHLESTGILLVNENRYLPSLADLGGEWYEIAQLVERREAFYSKVYRNRTTYLSAEVYFLLKAIRPEVPVRGESAVIYDFIREFGSTDTTTIKQAVLIDDRRFGHAFDFLLQHLLVTVLRTGRVLNPNWSTYVWGMAKEWEEQAAPLRIRSAEAAGRLQEILGRSLPERELAKLID